ncbi:MAG: ribonuclease P protein component [Candidatus Pacebacteria bacterium]|nr:ribonuclease P protein component [Candidatus Paceibacterota bacterium]
MQKRKNLFCFFFFVKIKENSFNFSRFAFVVPKKVEKKAVERNRTKRMMREIFKEFSVCFNRSVDLIFITQKKINKEDREKAKKEVERILKKAKLI